MRGRIAIIGAAVALLAAGSGVAFASSNTTDVTCTYDGSDLSCPFPQPQAVTVTKTTAKGTTTVTATKTVPTTVLGTVTQTNTVTPDPVTVTPDPVTVTVTSLVTPSTDTPPSVPSSTDPASSATVPAPTTTAPVTFPTEKPGGTKTVTTATGVVTHGAITTTKDTIGWLLTCPVSHRLSDDPITAPGVPGGAHSHDFTGNASINAFSTLASMEDPSNAVSNTTFNGGQAEAGTSCDLPTYAPGTAGDTAAYWRPTLYANGQVVQTGVKDQIYYRAKTLSGHFEPYPQDARIIVGSHTATSVDTNPAIVDEHLYWECNGDTGTHYAVPVAKCTSLLLNVVFPQCWDGQPMDHTDVHNTDNHHFGYAANDACPAAFPIQVPQLSEKFKYDDVPAGALLQFSADPGMGDMLMPLYTAHADFWNTWNPVALQYLVTNCLNAAISCGTNPITPLQ